jgi:hypothetical protein
VFSERNISFGMAKTIAETALDACRKDGSRDSDRARSHRQHPDFYAMTAAPHTYENSQRGLYRLTFRALQRMAERLTKNPGAVAKCTLRYQRRRWWLAHQSGQRSYRSSGCFRQHLLLAATSPGTRTKPARSRASMRSRFNYTTLTQIDSLSCAPRLLLDHFFCLVLRDAGKKVEPKPGVPFRRSYSR